MPLIEKSSWTRSSTGALAPSSTRPVSNGNGLRAGIVIALVALTLTIGFGRPAHTAAYQPDSLVCTTIEAGFQYTFDKALAAKGAGDTKGFTYWNKIAQGAQSLWFDMGCGEGSSGGGWQVS